LIDWLTASIWDSNAFRQLRRANARTPQPRWETLAINTTSNLHITEGSRHWDALWGSPILNGISCFKTHGVAKVQSIKRIRKLNNATVSTQTTLVNHGLKCSVVGRLCTVHIGLVNHTKTDVKCEHNITTADLYNAKISHLRTSVACSKINK